MSGRPHSAQRGLFEPLVMFSASPTATATFQTMMNEIFQDLISDG